MFVCACNINVGNYMQYVCVQSRRKKHTSSSLSSSSSCSSMFKNDTGDDGTSRLRIMSTIKCYAFIRVYGSSTY